MSDEDWAQLILSKDDEIAELFADLQDKSDKLTRLHAALEAQAARVKELEKELSATDAREQAWKEDAATLEAQLEAFREAATNIRNDKLGTSGGVGFGVICISSESFNALMSALRKMEEVK